MPLGLLLFPGNSSTTFRRPETLLGLDVYNNIVWTTNFSPTWLEDHVPVVQAGLEVHDALLGEPCCKHVLTVDLAPEIAVILRVITN